MTTEQIQSFYNKGLLSENEADRLLLRAIEEKYELEHEDDEDEDEETCGDVDVSEVDFSEVEI